MAMIDESRPLLGFLSLGPIPLLDSQRVGRSALRLSIFDHTGVRFSESGNSETILSVADVYPLTRVLPNFWYVTVSTSSQGEHSELIWVRRGIEL
jgi:hypothetical protein